MSRANDDDLDWRADAACLEYPAEMWFPENGAGGWPARKICRACPVKTQCLAFALDEAPEFGIFGGLGGRQRAQLRGAA